MASPTTRLSVWTPSPVVCGEYGLSQAQDGGIPVNTCTVSVSRKCSMEGNTVVSAMIQDLGKWVGAEEGIIQRQ